MLRHLLTALTVLIAVCSVASLAATRASALGGCSGQNQFTWTGGGEDATKWDDPQNWNPQQGAPPSGRDASATIQGTADNERLVHGGDEVCDLTLRGPNVYLTSNMTVAGDLTWTGGEELQPDSEIEGNFAVTGSADISKKVTIQSGRLTVGGELDVAGGSELTLAAGGTELIANGGGQLGGGLPDADAVIRSNVASGDNTNARLEVNSPISLGGDIESSQLDLDLNHSGSVDLDGNVWTLPGLSYSRWKGGSTVGSSSEGGIITFGDQANLLLDGSIEIARDALLSMQGSSVLTDGKPEFPDQPPGTVGGLHGEGALEWQSGTLQGNVTLGSGFRSILDGAGTHELTADPPATLLNDGTMDVQAGTLLVDGAPGRIDNRGRIEIHAGATLACNSDCRSAIDNSSGATVEITGPAFWPPPTVPPSTTTVFATDVGLSNSGDLRIGQGLKLLFLQNAVAGLAPGGFLSGGGILSIGAGGRSDVVGTTTLRDGTTISLDGAGAELHGGAVNDDGQLFGGMLSANMAGDGVLSWHEGGIEGSLLTGGLLQTDVDGKSTDHTVEAESRDPHQPTRNPTSITFAAPTRIDGATVDITSDQNGDAVSISGPMRMLASGSFTRNSSGDDGVIVNPHGTLKAEGEAAVKTPLTVLGRLEVPAGARLGVPLGYTQTGPSAVTALAGGTIDTREADTSEPHTIRLDGGALHGNGAVIGDLENGGGTVSPSVNGSDPGLLRIDGNFTHGFNGILSAHVAGRAPDRHDRLIVTGAAKLAGSLAVLEQGGYNPVAGTRIPDILDAATIERRFSHVNSVGTPYDRSWRDVYRPHAVDVLLVAAGWPRSGRGPVRVRLTGGGGVPRHRLLTPKLINSNGFTVKATKITVTTVVRRRKRGHPRSRTLTIGSARTPVSVGAHDPGRLKIHLTGSGLALLRRAHRLRIRIRVGLRAPNHTARAISVHRILRSR